MNQIKQTSLFFFRGLYCVSFKSSDSKLYERERKKQSDKAYHLFRNTPLPCSDTAIRKLLRTGQRAYDGGTKAMHRFTSRTPRFDSPRGKELYGRPSTPGGSTAPICRNCTSGNRWIFGDKQIIIREYRSFQQLCCLPLKGEKDCRMQRENGDRKDNIGKW